MNIVPPWSVLLSTFGWFA